jgi:hypothetical protein
LSDLSVKSRAFCSYRWNVGGGVRISHLSLLLAGVSSLGFSINAAAHEQCKSEPESAVTDTYTACPPTPPQPTPPQPTPPQPTPPQPTPPQPTPPQPTRTPPAVAFVDPSSITSNVVQTQVQTAVEDARERLFDRRDADTAAHAGTGAPIGYAPDSASPYGANSPFGNLDYTAQFGALGYADLPTKKAPTPTPTPSPVTFAAWGSGTFDYENVSGTFKGSPLANTSRAGGGLVGADWTVPLSNGAYFLGGVLGGDTFMSIASPGGVSTWVQAPTVGAYAAYLIGGFSFDAMYTSTWIDADSTVPFSSSVKQDSVSQNVSGNFQYRFNLEKNWWVEPTVGSSWTYTFEEGNIPNEEVLRLLGGVRAGTSAMWGNVRVEPVVTGQVYSDVVARGGGEIIGFTPVAADRDQLWGKGIVKLNFVWSQNFSTYVQSEVHGTDGIQKQIGFVGTGGLRWSF